MLKWDYFSKFTNTNKMKFRDIWLHAHIWSMKKKKNPKKLILYQQHAKQYWKFNL